MRETDGKPLAKGYRTKVSSRSLGRRVVPSMADGACHRRRGAAGSPLGRPEKIPGGRTASRSRPYPLACMAVGRLPESTPAYAVLAMCDGRKAFPAGPNLAESRGSGSAIGHCAMQSNQPIAMRPALRNQQSSNAIRVCDSGLRIARAECGEQFGGYGRAMGRVKAWQAAPAGSGRQGLVERSKESR
jgi:hypothetical protein